MVTKDHIAGYTKINLFFGSLVVKVFKDQKSLFTAQASASFKRLDVCTPHPLS